MHPCCEHCSHLHHEPDGHRTRCPFPDCQGADGLTVKISEDSIETTLTRESFTSSRYHRTYPTW